MAYSVNWLTKVITIPLSDLTLVSGSNYTLDVADVHVEIRRLEAAFAEGLWAPEIINFFPTVTLSGIAKPPTVEFKNGYTVVFGGSNYNVSVSGYDTNMLDVLIPGNGINVALNNSVGKIVTGSGLDATQDLYLTKLHRAHFNRRNHDTAANTITIYDSDNVTPLHVFDADDELTDITPQ